MKNPLTSALLGGTLIASVLASPAAAQEITDLCNGLEPTIVGTEGDDVIYGTSKADVIVGLGGNDVIVGGSGNDVICGGAGNDTINGNSQKDTIFGGSGNDTIRGGSDMDTIDGGAGDDTIFGNSQKDTIFGGAGNDIINGGPDKDTLDGGPGVDSVDGSSQDDTCSNAETTISCEIEGPSVDAVVVPVLLSEQEMNWSQGGSEWVNLMWTADGDLANVSVHLSDLSEGLEVTYPSDTNSSRLGVDSDLSKSEIDFTAVKLTTTSAGAKYAVINISWDNEAGERQSSPFKLVLSNKSYKGEDFAILTEAVSVGTDVDAPAKNWIDLDYKGLAPTNHDMQMSVSSDDMPVYHPQETFTSLHHDQVLHAGEADVARVWFDPELITTGEHTVVVNIKYVDTNGKKRTVAHKVSVTVQ